MAQRFENERFIDLLERIIDDNSKDVEKIKGRVDLLEYKFDEYTAKNKDRVRENNSVKLIHIKSFWKLIFMIETALIAYFTWKYQK